MQATIVRSHNVYEFPAPEGCQITENWNTPDDPDVSIARARVKPGKTTELHALEGSTERYLVVQGIGLVDIEGLGEWEPVEQGDIVVIPAGRAQRIKNTGSVDLLFYCICTPRFQNSMYRPVEENEKPREGNLGT